MEWLWLLCMYPVLPVMYFQLRNEARPKKNILLGVTLPYAGLSDPDVCAVAAGYTRHMRLAFWLLHLPLISCFFIHSFSTVFCAAMLWLLAVMAVFYWLYISAHLRLRACKRALYGPAAPSAPETLVQVDVNAIAKGAPDIRPIWYLPPLLLALLPIPLDFLLHPDAVDRWEMLAGCLCFFLVVGLFPFVDRALRRRSEAAAADSDLNAALTQMRRGHWCRCCLWNSYLTGVFALLFYFLIREHIPEWAGMLLTLFYTLGVIFVTMRADLACRHAQERLAGSLPTAVDTDAQWPLGLFYRNPADPHNVVHNRTGIGSTFNIARPLGKVMLGFTALSLLSLPVLCVWMVAEERTPIRVEQAGDTLTITHLMVQERFAVANGITEVAYHEALPHATRIVGSGMPNLLEGKFDVAGFGVCYLYLDPTEGPFVSFLADGKRIFLNASAAVGVPALQQAAR